MFACSRRDQILILHISSYTISKVITQKGQAWLPRLRFPLQSVEKGTSPGLVQQATYLPLLPRVVVFVCCCMQTHRQTSEELEVHLGECGISFGMSPWSCCEWGRGEGSTAASHVSHTRGRTFSWADPFAVTVQEPSLAAALRKGSWDSTQRGSVFLRDPQMSMARAGNSLVLSLEGGWRRGKAAPALHLPPRVRFMCRYLFVSFT